MGEIATYPRGLGHGRPIKFRGTWKPLSTLYSTSSFVHDHYMREILKWRNDLRASCHDGRVFLVKMEEIMAWVLFRNGELNLIAGNRSKGGGDIPQSTQRRGDIPQSTHGYDSYIIDQTQRMYSKRTLLQVIKHHALQNTPSSFLLKKDIPASHPSRETRVDFNRKGYTVGISSGDPG